VWRGGAPLVVGHRGGRGEGWPAENTIAAFVQAAKQGARAIELDVRTTKDGEVVVFHDADLARMTGGDDVRVVAELSWPEARGARLRPSDDPMPTLAETLAWAVQAGVAVNVEMKHDVPDRARLARGVASIVRASRADVLLSSFDPTLLGFAAALAPEIPRALLTHARQRHAETLHAIARPPAAFALHVERTQTAPRDIAAWKRRGLRVGVWTVNDPREALDLVRVGVDFVISDRPGEILAAIVSSTRT
jgi:glycerophosphoryl diester phosphodiesterase